MIISFRSPPTSAWSFENTLITGQWRIEGNLPHKPSPLVGDEALSETGYYQLAARASQQCGGYGSGINKQNK